MALEILDEKAEVAIVTPLPLLAGVLPWDREDKRRMDGEQNRRTVSAPPFKFRVHEAGRIDSDKRVLPVAPSRGGDTEKSRDGWWLLCHGGKEKILLDLGDVLGEFLRFLDVLECFMCHRRSNHSDLRCQAGPNWVVTISSYPLHDFLSLSTLAAMIVVMTMSAMMGYS
ncbi:hypothetical protein PIB30_033560 [Stylosanthes scabra]|uniref:Uncharacterized protein n=1 Tax=Stylosanthes scabra TaxID=79078 RepID=A0ABU6VER2_9FABA|nr:hypothetical protein [Stylosanthes scabra]